MDKLQPLIKQRFWILLGLVIPLAIYAYSSAGGMGQEAEARAKQLDQVKNGIPGGADLPNEKYSKGLSEVNSVYSVYVDEAIVEIWERQKKRMTWPASFAAKVPAEFQGEFKVIDDLYAYQTGIYPQWMDEVYARVNPVKPVVVTPGEFGFNVPPAANSTNFQGQKVIVTAPLPQATFNPSITIVSRQLWEAQVDSWLLMLLFDQIAKTNEHADTIADAAVRRIDRLEFMGGDGVPAASGAVNPTGEAASIDPGYNNSDGSEGGGYRAPSAAIASVAFAPAQEFGNPVGSAPGLAPGPDAAAVVTEADPEAHNKSRYIAYNPALPYFQRGFYLSVIVLQEKVPDFLTNLANAEWPIKVERFHVGANPYAERMTPSRMGRDGGGRGRGFGFGLGGNGLNPFPEGFNQDLNPEFVPMFRGGGGAQGAQVPRLTAATIPPFADAALKHPDLVQVDLCGRITMFRPPADVLARLAAAKGNENPPGAVQQPPPSSP